MCSAQVEYPDNFPLKIGCCGVSQICFTNQISDRIAAVGTTDGRVRIYSCNGLNAHELYRKKWHSSIYKLEFSPTSPKLLFSTSVQSGVKVHDVETHSKLWCNLNAHGISPITALYVLDDNLFYTGDDIGVIRFWDRRSSKDFIYQLLPETDENGVEPDTKNELFCVNDLTMNEQSKNHLFAARDDGALVTYSVRKRCHQLTSDTVGFSARCVKVVKDGTKLVLGTDEGVITMFSWNEFGQSCDRFPVRTCRAEKAGLSSSVRSGSGAVDWPSVECITKISEDIIAVATDDGAISAMSLLPNRMLASVGQHRLKTEDEDFLGVATGDCMSIAVSGDKQVLASVTPSSNVVRFYPIQHFPALYEEEKDMLATPIRKRDVCVKLKTANAKRKKLIVDVQAERRRNDFMSGLVDSQNNGPKNEDDDSSNEESGKISDSEERSSDDSFDEDESDSD